MDIQRIQREIRQASEHFAYLEAQPTSAGGISVKAAMQTTAGGIFIIAISFDGYPTEMPKVAVTKPEIVHMKHRYINGNICYMHPNMWNPGRHDLKFVLMQVAVWLNKHEVYTRNGGAWPGKEILHHA